MRRKKLKPGHNPDHYACKNPNCKRTTPLDIRLYAMSPSADTPEDEIHRVHEPQMGGFSVMCSACAHFTVVSRHPVRLNP
jgi:hypothetical protein